jgi:protein-S-isoprenylcysteine O-methyltransferase Ste14/pimeloyl-ACP methyl ester carboxylesterase
MAGIPRLVRAVAAFLVLPGVVAFGVPAMLLQPVATRTFHPIGLVPLIPGLLLLLWCVRDFYVVGKGTLAPWDPPRRLVIVGLYRISRNPMYVAVTLILIGWAIGFRSRALAIYAPLVPAAFHLRVVLGEEPWLARTHREEWQRYAARVPRWLFLRRRNLLLGLLVLCGALPVAGLLYEAIAEARAAGEFVPPGRLIDVGGRRLHLVCIGAGEPTVMFEASGFGVSSLASATVRQLVSAQTTACSYDRMGMGWSDPGPGAASAAVLARDLAVLQDRAPLRPPFIVVSSSIGGLTTEMFARQYPERVAGLVFLDAATSEMLPRLAPRLAMVRAMTYPVSAAAWIGLVRLIDPFGIGEESEAARRSAGFTYSPMAFGSTAAIVRSLPDTLREFQAAPPLPADVPLVVLSADRPLGANTPGLRRIAAALRAGWLDEHRQLAKRSRRGVWRVVPDSEHLIAISHPDAVADAVLAMLVDIRRGNRGSPSDGH